MADRLELEYNRLIKNGQKAALKFLRAKAKPTKMRFLRELRIIEKQQDKVGRKWAYRMMWGKDG